MSQQAPSQSGTVALSQQGTIDWTSLSKTTVNFTVEVLGRFLHAGVQPATVRYGQEVARRMPLSKHGQANIQTALESLHSHRGLGDLLWFGFGVNSLVRTLGATAEGLSLVALCAALGECFHEDFGADVLNHLFLCLNPPDALTPSLTEWLSLVKNCCGLLSATKFPRLVEGFDRIIRRETIGSPTGDADWPVPAPESLALVLWEVGLVTIGKQQSVTIRGTPGAAWIAAVAEWLFDLRLSIVDLPARGGQLYAGDEARQPQVIIDLSLLPSDSAESSALTVTEKTYYLEGCDLRRLLAMDTLDRVFYYGGRLRWDSCFGETFGASFRQLETLKEPVARALGCAARIFEGVARPRASSDILDQSLHDLHHQHTDYVSKASGTSFLTFSRDKFLELVPLLEHADNELKRELPDAITCYLEALDTLRTHCICFDCDRSSTNTSLFQNSTFCLAALVLTLFNTCQILSGVIETDDIGLRRWGLESLYSRSHNVLYGRGYREELSAGTTPARRCIEGLQEASHTDLSSVLELYCARTFMCARESAYSGGGVCAYLYILQDFCLDAEMMGHVVVTRGLMEHRKKTFSSLRDQTENPIQPPARWPSSTQGIGIVLKEAITSVTADLVFTNWADGSVSFSSKRPGERISIGPLSLVRMIQNSRGLVHCFQNSRICERRVSVERRYRFVFPDDTPNSADARQEFRPCLPIHLQQVGIAPEYGHFDCEILDPAFASDVAKGAALVAALGQGKAVVLLDYQCLACAADATGRVLEAARALDHATMPEFLFLQMNSHLTKL